MGTGYLIYGDVIIAVDCFSNKTGALKAGETRHLDLNLPLRQQIYEALSGSKWDSEFFNKMENQL